MTKLKISQKQYETILLREQETRLNARTAILNEKTSENTNLIKEDWRGVVLGVALMLGVNLTGQNKILAQNAVKNAGIMKRIKSTIEDEDKTKELIKSFEEKGMGDPSTRFADNAEKITDAFNKFASDNKLSIKVNTKAVYNLQDLKSGDYSLLPAVDEVSTEEKILIKIQDTIEIELGSNNLFNNGGYTLSPGGKDVLSIAIQEFEKKGGKIENLVIETSSDSTPTPKLKDNDDPTGNIKLCELRTRSVSDLINSIDSGISMTHREIPNNGFHVSQKNDEVNYVKLTVVAVFEQEGKPEEIIKNYRKELTKVLKDITSSNNITGKVSFNNKKFKCKKTDCSTF